MSERRPEGVWTETPWPFGPKANASAWRSGPIMVMSELVDAEYPDGSGHGPQWLVSISSKGKRPKPKQVRRALRAFGMVGAEEDQHHPGIARHFWRPLDPARRVDCQCKVDEETIEDGDGYRWTTPVDGPCRGCEYRELTGSPCPIHDGEHLHEQGAARRMSDRL